MNYSTFFQKKNKIGDILLLNGKIEQNQLARALSHQESVNHCIGDILLSLGFIGEDDLVGAVAEQLSLDVYQQLSGDKFLPLEISSLFHREHPFALIYRPEAGNILVVNDPLDGDILSAIEILLHEPYEIQLVSESYIKKLVNEHYKLIHESDSDEMIIVESDIDKLKDMASEAPVIKYVNSLIETAVSRRASDIHMEPYEDGLKVRFRIDGTLHDYEIPPFSMQAAIVSRTKLLAALDIAERRLPQDGKVSMRTAGKEIDLRVSTLPTVYGEGVVIRILEQGSIILELAHLGMNQQIEQQFRQIIALPDGIILVTGPTGSGKTTTLYCALNYINSGDNKIITVEDPVEYQLHGINQIQVRPEIGLTFAKGLRSIVRQDPDVIMIGEIRDIDTAEIAVQSSLTGHVVFSTLHTNDAVSAVIRMVDLGIERFLISSTLRGIMAQRLVRCICTKCKIQRGRISDTGYQPEDNDDFEMFEGKGCKACANTGYLGRIGLYELLVVNDAINRAISQGVDLVALKKIAELGGFQPMFTDGVAKVKQGITTFAEVMRVCRGTENESV